MDIYFLMRIKNKIYSKGTIFSGYWSGIGLLLLLNFLAWLPFLCSNNYHIGWAHDSQIVAPALNAIFWRSNAPWEPLLRIYEARVDIFSFPGISALYPFRWILGISPELPFKQLLVLCTVYLGLHQVLASVTFFIFLYRLGCRTILCALGGMSYAYSHHLMNWSSWIWAFSAYTWLPLCLLGIWMIFGEQRNLLGIIWLGLGVGLVALANGVILVHVIILCFIFSIAFILLRGYDLRFMVRNATSISAGCVCGALLGASSIIPTLMRSDEYVRWYTGGRIIGDLKVPYEATLVSPIHEWGAWHLFLPMNYGNSLGDVFVGLGVMFLSGYLVIYSQKWRRCTIILLVGAGYFLLNAMGDATPIHRLTYNIPLIGSFRYPIAHGIVVIVCLLVPAFLGAEKILHDLPLGKPVKISGLVLCVVSLIVLASAVLFRDEMQFVYRGNLGFGLLVISLLGCFLGSVIFILLKQDSKLVSYVPLLLLFSSFPLNTLFVQAKILQPSQEYLACDEFRKLTESLPGWQKELGRDSRLVTWYNNDDKSSCLSHYNLGGMFFDSIAMSAGWNVCRPYISPRPYREFSLFNRLSNKSVLESQDGLLQAGVSHVLSNIKPDKVPYFYRAVRRSGIFTLYEIDRAKLGQNLVGCIETSHNGEKWLTNSTGKRRITILKDESFAVMEMAECVSGNKLSQKIQTERSKSGSSIIYKIEVDQSALLVTDRVNNDNWRVKINGKDIMPFTLDGYRITVPVERGNNIVSLRYQPKDFRFSIVCTLLGIILLILLGQQAVRWH